MKELFVCSMALLVFFVKMEWILLELKMQLDKCTINAQLDTKTQCKTMTVTSKPLEGETHHHLCSYQQVATEMRKQK